MKTLTSTLFIVCFCAFISAQSTSAPANSPWSLNAFKTGQAYHIQEYLEEILEVVEPIELIVSAAEVQYVSCFGNEDGKISLKLKGGTKEKLISWKNGLEGDVINNLTAGIYEANISDRLGREIEVYFTVEEPSRMEVELVEKVNIDDSSTSGAFDISMSGGVPPYAYEWSNGMETEDISGLDFGQYFLKVRDSKGCVEEFGPFEIENLLAVEDIESLNEIKLFPNPAVEFLIVELNFSRFTKVNLSIMNSFGQQLFAETIEASHIEKILQLNDYPSGVYFIEIQVGNESIIRRFIKQ